MIAAAVVIVAVVGVVLIASGGDEEQQRLVGSFTLFDDDQRFPEEECRGSGGYSDVRPGLDVVVRDGEGKILATGALEGGSGVESICIFRFELADVPRADFYSIEVGRRGALTYSREELEELEWLVAFELGS